MRFKTPPVGVHSTSVEPPVALTVRAVRCAVCGTDLSDPTRTCARCDTAVHAECWEYGGGCPRFACPESRCLREMALRCPVCARSAYSTWSGRHPLVMHWKLNPGLAINELLLGQRVPETLFVCTACEAPMAERSWVVCTQCQRVTRGSHWMAGMAFGHWLGLVCPHCGLELPTTRNWTAAAVTWLTAPLWWLAYARMKRPYLAWARSRAQARLAEQRDRRHLDGQRVTISKERLLALEDPE